MDAPQPLAVVAIGTLLSFTSPWVGGFASGLAQNVLAWLGEKASNYERWHRRRYRKSRSFARRLKK